MRRRIALFYTRYSLTMVLLAGILVTIVGCDNNEEPRSNSQVINSVSVPLSTDNKGNKNDLERVPLFQLGMDIEEVRAILEENNIEIINEIENTGDSDTWDWGNKSIWTEEISFTFDQDYILYDLEFDNGEPTSEGIKVGDDLDLLLNKYGDQFKLYGPEELMNMWIIDENQDKKAEIYEYRMDDHYFRAFVVDDKIVSWNISKYKLGTNSPVTEDYSEEADPSFEPNSGMNSNEESELALGATHADSYEPEMLIRAYEEAIADAINNDDFSIVEKYLIKDSEIYQEQKQFISDLHAQGVTYSLNSFNIENWEQSASNFDEYKFYVKETIGLHDSNQNENTEKTDYWVYTIISNETELGIMNKEIWENAN